MTPGERAIVHNVINLQMQAKHFETTGNEITLGFVHSLM